MNFADIIVAVGVIGAAALAIAILRRNKKTGKSCCGCDCGSCAQDCRRK